MKYYVMQMNINNEGVVTPGVYIKDTETEALKLFYQKSAADIDNANYAESLEMVVRSDGYTVAINHFGGDQ